MIYSTYSKELTNQRIDAFSGSRIPNTNGLTKKSTKLSAKYFMDVIKEIESSGDSIDQAADLVVESLKNGSSLYIAGNGGSAAAASHFGADLSMELFRSYYEYKSKIISMCDSNSLITAIANDYGYENVFSMQMTNCVPNDILLLMSVSGESKNLLNAVWTARTFSMKVISIVARKSTLSDISDHSIIFGASDYGISEDFQTMFLHMVKRLINNNNPHKYI